MFVAMTGCTSLQSERQRTHRVDCYLRDRLRAEVGEYSAIGMGGGRRRSNRAEATYVAGFC